MLTTNQIHWVAGLLEGEGCFGLTNSGKTPCIWLSMTDRDVVDKLRSIVDSNLSLSITKDERKESYKDIYRLTINGTRAASWMMTIYPLMSIRRKSRITECLLAWKDSKINLKLVNSPEAKARAGFIRRLNQMGFSSKEVEFARQLHKLKCSEDEIFGHLNAHRKQILEQEKE